MARITNFPWPPLPTTNIRFAVTAFALAACGASVDEHFDVLYAASLADKSLEGSYQELFDQGLARYVDSPATREVETTMSGSAEDPISVHHFSAANRGPVCMYGAEFNVETRAGSSEDLLIYLEPGGVCIDSICAATPNPIFTLDLFGLGSAFGLGGLLDPGNADNPLRNYDVVNVPYCDGSLFMGDVDRVLSDGDPLNGEQDQAYQRGLQNLTAALETAHRTFPRPKRVVLAGSSGGAYGVVVGTAMVRRFYPEQPLLVIADSGMPIVNGYDREFIVRSVEQFGATNLIPASCPECLSNGHTTGYVEWLLRVDRNLTIGYMTHARDHVIGEFFMGTTAAQFEDEVTVETQSLMRDFPGRFFRFVAPSNRHTFSLSSDVIDPVLLGTLLGVVGTFKIGFVGPDVTPEELSTWSFGGMNETGIGEDGRRWTGYRWVDTLVNRPADLSNVFQLQ